MASLEKLLAGAPSFPLCRALCNKRTMSIIQEIKKSWGWTCHLDHSKNAVCHPLLEKTVENPMKLKKPEARALTIIKIFLMLTMFSTIIACSEPVLNVSTESGLKKSFSKIVASLPAEEREEIVLAFMRIQNAYMGHIAFHFEGDTKSIRKKRFHDSLAGMNAQQILDESVRIEQAWSLGSLLRARKDLNDYQDVVELLDKVKLKSIEFIPLDYPLGKTELEAVISNGTEHTLYAIDFSTDLLYDNGSFSRKYHMYFEIPDGIAPREEKKVKAYSRVRSNKGMAQGFDRYINFITITLYDLVDGKPTKKIATSNFGVLPTPEKADIIEAKYRSKYGKSEPAEWSANIIREMAKHNMYRGY